MGGGVGVGVGTGDGAGRAMGGVGVGTGDGAGRAMGGGRSDGGGIVDDVDVGEDEGAFLTASLQLKGAGFPSTIGSGGGGGGAGGGGGGAAAATGGGTAGSVGTAAVAFEIHVATTTSRAAMASNRFKYFDSFSTTPTPSRKEAS